MSIRLLAAALVVLAAALAAVPAGSATTVCVFSRCTGIACPGGPQCVNVAVDACPNLLTVTDAVAGVAVTCAPTVCHYELGSPWACT